MFIYMINWLLIITIFFSVLYAANKTNVDGDRDANNGDEEELDGFID